MHLKLRSLVPVVFVGLAIGALAYVGVSYTSGGQNKQQVAEGPATLASMRRLTEQQYRNTIGDVFGRNIVGGGRFDPLARTGGLLEVGAGSARVTPSGFEQYYDMAHTIAAQVVSAANRGPLISCKPKDATLPDDECASAYYSSVGRLLYRRPLEKAEV